MPHVNHTDFVERDFEEALIDYGTRAAANSPFYGYAMDIISDRNFNNQLFDKMVKNSMVVYDFFLDAIGMPPQQAFEKAVMMTVDIRSAIIAHGDRTFLREMERNDPRMYEESLDMLEEGDALAADINAYTAELTRSTRRRDVGGRHDSRASYGSYTTGPAKRGGGRYAPKERNVNDRTHGDVPARGRGRYGNSRREEPEAQPRRAGSYRRNKAPVEPNQTNVQRRTQKKRPLVIEKDKIMDPQDHIFTVPLESRATDHVSEENFFGTLAQNKQPGVYDALREVSQIVSVGPLIALSPMHANALAMCLAMRETDNKIGSNDIVEFNYTELSPIKTFKETEYLKVALDGFKDVLDEIKAIDTLAALYGLINRLNELTGNPLYRTYAQYLNRRATDAVNRMIRFDIVFDASIDDFSTDWPEAVAAIIAKYNTTEEELAKFISKFESDIIERVTSLGTVDLEDDDVRFKQACRYFEKETVEKSIFAERQIFVTSLPTPSTQLGISLESQQCYVGIEDAPNLYRAIRASLQRITEKAVTYRLMDKIYLRCNDNVMFEIIPTEDEIPGREDDKYYAIRLVTDQ